MHRGEMPSSRGKTRQPPARFVRQLRTAEQWEVVTRWRFERLLDQVASRVADHLREPSRGNPLGGKIGCSLLYRTHENCYVLGGSARDRRRMDRQARYYDLSREEAQRSLTGTVIRLGAVMVLDDMARASSMRKLPIEHRKKNCELEATDQKAFLAIPASTRGDPRVLTESSTPPEEPGQRPDGVLRFTFSEAGNASRALELLPKNLLHEISILLRWGRRAVARNRDNRPLALADLGNDLLSYRHSEYQGLDQLAFHLQTHYDDCECSIFLARERPGTVKGRTKVDLFLAATTALSASEQHEEFRETFQEGGRFYTCVFDESGQPDEKELARAAKTERAYYEPNRLVVVNENLGSRRYPGRGEIELPKEYMAFAIPSPKADERPYGVIRLVRYTEEKFSDRDRRLAQATTRYLRSWLELFPLNPGLRIENQLEDFVEEVLVPLFDIAKGSGYEEGTKRAEREFTWLLQKIFHRSEQVTIRERFSGRSGSLVLLVENDSGLDLILKCERKREPWEHVDNDIRREVDNYREYIEGKLELNHNIIFQELVRETQWLVGFATSFLHSTSKQRISVTEACRQWQDRMGSLPRLERALTQVIEKLTLEVWAWWYSPAGAEGEPQGETEERRRTRERRKEHREDAATFVAHLREDRLFGFLNDLDKLDERVVHRLREIPGYKREFGPRSEYPPPSGLWKRFEASLGDPRRKIPWRETVTHGDTHGDNIFFDPVTMDLWVIDFARTGWRTDIFDLALIEADLKLRQLPHLYGDERRRLRGKTFVDRFLGFERELARQRSYEEPVLPPPSGDPELASIGKLVTDVRQLACQGLGRRGDFTDYQITLLLLAFKYMKVQKTAPEHRLLAYLSARELVQLLAP